MAYTDFTIESAEAELGFTTRSAPLFGELRPAAAPSWLTDVLQRGRQLALISEKSRSEFLVAPVLLAVRELCDRRVSILSGQRLDVDPARRLTGECDFLLTLSSPVPVLRAPLLAVVEAKKNDIEFGLGQCMAQMAAARRFNDAGGRAASPVFGCVTTGEAWQFLRYDDRGMVVDQDRRYIDAVGGLLAAFVAAVKEAEGQTSWAETCPACGFVRTAVDPANAPDRPVGVPRLPHGFSGTVLGPSGIGG